MDPVGIPNLWKDEASVVPVLLRSTAGVVQTSVLRTGITAKFACGNDTAIQSFAPAADQWTELGEGHYLMTFPTTVPDALGPFVYQVATTATGNETFIANSRVEERVDNYQAMAVPRYAQTDADACIIAWLQKNGRKVTTPTSARVVALDEAGNTVIDSTSILPDANGFFLLTIDPLTLTALKAHRVRVIIVSAGVTYESGEAFITFN
jgi:hypothetical protein